HARQTVLYRKDLEKEHLFPYLVSLCKAFYEQQSREQDPLGAPESGHVASGPAADDRRPGFHCRHCLTVYEEEYGDPDQAVAPGTPFAELDEGFVCPVCGGPISDFAVTVVT
ncbi:MAG TPA: rubredoxin, partial [Puia sp.]|nr:rubredoxin [Puia sp.]